MKNDPFEKIRRMQEMWSKVNSPFIEMQKQIALVNQVNMPFQHIQEQMNLIHSSLNSVSLDTHQAMLRAFNPVFEQVQELTLNNNILNAQRINEAFRIDFAKISPILEFAQKQNFTLNQISQSDKAYGELTRWESLLHNISDSTYLDDEVEDVEITLRPTSVPLKETAGELIQNDRQSVQPFTWRDLLQIASLLITLITWLDSGNSRTTSLAEEAYKVGSDAVMEINETLDGIYEFFISNFPAYPDDSGGDPELPENP
ncbi:hypothetical protein ACFLFF_31415 [Brevibacillus reuszeri]|uniref:hypothetical protein n=1 Tax=Brevibacillus reuszeri TaxID=54915 RepID=UPI00366C3443